MNNLKILLSQTNSLLNNYEKLAKITGENFNIFSVMGMESNEVKTHSAIIGELLNPKGSHGLDEVPLKLFIEQITSGLNNVENPIDLNSKFSLDTKNSHSIVEEHAGIINEDKTEGGRIDIVIKDKANKAILIENKIYAGEQENQLLRYNNKYPDAPILFLTLNGNPPSSVGEKMTLNETYFLISYKKDIIEWLEKCLKEAVKFPMLREVIQQYIYLLKKLTHQTTNNQMAAEIKEIIKANYLAAKEIHNNFNKVKQEVLESFWNDLERELKNDGKIKNEGWEVKTDTFSFQNQFRYLLIYSKAATDKCYFYFRYNINTFETLCGIIINREINLDNIKEFTGKEINEILGLDNLKSAKNSVIYSSMSYANFNNDGEILKMLSVEEKKKLINEYSEKILEYVFNNEHLFKKISDYLNSDEFKQKFEKHSANN
ncbi:PD-(D/E)XK nuclease family protein [Flavobacterium ovatum]|uniref:PD-(D/E)XK nuclease family protein n=1 Tax=Flavobacterium ovatum TaxID=1928857 RepID=UPI003450BFFC